MSMCRIGLRGPDPAFSSGLATSHLLHHYGGSSSGDPVQRSPGMLIAVRVVQNGIVSLKGWGEFDNDHSALRVCT